jgi:hypothetical protein
LHFEGAQLVTTEKAFSGLQAIKLDAENQFGFNFKVPEVFAKSVFKISVKRYSAFGNGYLIVQAANSELLYLTKGYGESDW